MNELSVIHNLPNSDYHNRQPYSDYLSSSQLKWYANSPRYARFRMDNPQSQTDAQKFGSLFHDLMASLAKHNGEWFPARGEWLDTIAIFEPPINENKNKPYGPTTNVYKYAYVKFLAENKSKQILSKEDAELCMAMAFSLTHQCGSTSEQIRKLLNWGEPEVSHFLIFEDCMFKFRPDLETRKKIIDYKTIDTDDLSERSINNSIARYGYDISAAFYQFMEHEQSGVWKDFYWCFVSKRPPFDAVLVDARRWTYDYDPDSGIVIPQVGAIKMRRLLDLHIKCTKEVCWPGAEINIPKDGYGNCIMLPTPPPWEINAASIIIEQSFNI